MFSMTTNIYNKKTKGPNLMEFFTAISKRKKFFFFSFHVAVKNSNKVGPLVFLL